MFAALDDLTTAFVTTQVSWDDPNCWFVNSYKRFKKVIEPLSPQSSSPRSVRIFMLDCSILKIVALIAYKTSITIYHSTQRNIPEDYKLSIFSKAFRQDVW